MDNNLCRRIKDGCSTSWLGDTPLSRRFFRLFSIAASQDVIVGKCGRIYGTSIWSNSWRRGLFFTCEMTLASDFFDLLGLLSTIGCGDCIRLVCTLLVRLMLFYLLIHLRF